MPIHSLISISMYKNNRKKIKDLLTTSNIDTVEYFLTVNITTKSYIHHNFDHGNFKYN